MTVANARDFKRTSDLQQTHVAAFRRRFSGSLVLTGDDDYNSARRVWNGMIDKRPAIIAYCAKPSDVVESIAFARETGVPIAVRAGGHNIAGKSLCENGLVIDLSRMRRVAIDPQSRTARAEGGALLADLDVASQAHGLATTTGVNSDTGLVGLTLGGGIGRLGRKHGLSCDNMLSAEVVTADGRILKASEDDNADLFWAVRGGGGNFGVVTEVVYRLHPLGPKVLAGSLIYRWRDARAALRLYAGFSAGAPEEISVDAALVTLPDGDRAVSISAFYAGPLEEGERALAPLRSALTPLEDRICPIPYVELQRAGDATFPRGDRFFWKAQFLRTVPDAAIDALMEIYPAAPSPRSLFVFQQVGGAIARAPAEQSAYANRDAAYDAFPVSIWTDPAQDEANVAWVSATYEAMRPFGTNGVYVNNLGDEGEDRVMAAYGANYRRLAALKRKFDPENLFRANQNVRPAG
ncbi:MAG TPA: FAD-binding oxidoreductase [Roseiarcus sp.]|nr:FAD-binding oxidoreductase [Roseiarcus sp.]